MERLPKIIMMLIAMTAIFLWVSTAFNSCGDKDELGDHAVLVDEESDVFSDDLGEDIFGDDEEDEDFLFSDEDDEDVVEDDNVETDFTATPVDDSEPAYTAPASKPKTPRSTSGQYMVIAGNYLVEANANQMIRKLRNLGYDNAEIGIFDQSQYHTVIASRHSSHSSAITSSNDIKYKGVDCYVKKKTY